MLISELLTNAGIIIGIPIIRAVAGWAPKALADNKVVKFEWKQLVQTVIRVGTMGAFAFFGLNLVGVENAALAAGIASFFADKLFSALKKTLPVRK